MRTLSAVEKGLVVTGCVMLAASLAVPGDTPEPSESPVTVKLVLAKKTFVLGEKVLVEMVAANSGPGEVQVGLRPGMASESSHFDVENAAGEPVEYIGPQALSSDRGSEPRLTVPPEKQVSHKVDLASLYALDQPGKYRVRCYALLGNERIYSAWEGLEIVTGTEAFRRDVPMARETTTGPKRETLSIIVYALSDSHVAYYKRVFEKDGKETTLYRQLKEKVDPTHEPQVVEDAEGAVHVLLADRPWTKAEAEKQFKDNPELYKEHMDYRYYTHYRFFLNEGGLARPHSRRVYVRREDETKLRLVKDENGSIGIRTFKDLGPYRRPE